MNTQLAVENTETRDKAISMRDRQGPLINRYKQNPEAAQIIDYAKTTSNAIKANDPLHAQVLIDRSHKVPVTIGVHHLLGGDGDKATPGDLLCGALASCFDSTTRIIANHMGLTLESLSVEVKGFVDARGTLLVDPAVCVGFRRFDVHIAIKAKQRLNEEVTSKLIKAVEHSCVVYQTLNHSVEINTVIT